MLTHHLICSFDPADTCDPHKWSSSIKLQFFAHSIHNHNMAERTVWTQQGLWLISSIDGAWRGTNTKIFEPKYAVIDKLNRLKESIIHTNFKCTVITWGPKAIMFINIDIRRNDRLSAYWRYLASSSVI